MMYDPDIPKTDDEIELENILRQLIDRLSETREDSAAYKMIVRQMEGIRHGSELGSLLMEEYDIGATTW
jgi:hypothetical protein